MMKIRERLIKWLGGITPSAPVEYVHSNMNVVTLKSTIITDHPAGETEAQHEIARRLGEHFLYDNSLIYFNTTPMDDGTTKVEGSIYIGKKED